MYTHTTKGGKLIYLRGERRCPFKGQMEKERQKLKKIKLPKHRNIESTFIM